MNRQGHIGMTLLAFAPLAYYLVSDGKLLLAVVSLGAIHVIEPLPDQDFHMPGLTHRGVSHSLVAVLVVGGILGGGGWLLGEHLFDMVHHLITAGGDLWAALLGVLPSFSAAVFRGLVPSIPLHEVVTTLHQQAGENLRWSLGAFGFGVGAYGIVTHLLGDVITVRGIKPFLPLSHWRLSLSSLRADSPVANSALLGLGVVAIGVVVVMTAPGALLGASAPANLSPVGVAAGQDSDTHNASVTINETESTRTQIELANVTLPENGYIVARSGNISANTNTSAQGKVLGRTQYVRHGSFSNVVLNLSAAVNTSQTVSVTIHNDTNGNKTWDGAKTDAAYRGSGGVPIHDTVRLGVNSTENTTTTDASVELDSSNNTTANTVVVSQATLPDGGYVVIHGEGFSRSGTLRSTEITASKHLAPGTHRNITLPVRRGVPGAITNSSRLNATEANLSVVAYQETNNNSHYDFTASRARNDTPYTTKTGEPVADTETVAFEVNAKRLREQTQPASATLQFSDQRLRHENGSAVVVVRNVTLEDGGFVAVHTEDFLPPTRNPLDSGLGHSEYLKPGSYHNVTVPLSTESIESGQTLVAVPYQDTNGNQRYDYIQSGGETDLAYIERTHGSTVIVNRTATVSAPKAPQERKQATATPEIPKTPSENSSENVSKNATSGVESKQNSLFGGNFWLYVGGGFVIIVVGLSLIGRLLRGR